ncbi:G1 family glutamic endopeptidase [Bradyrhizobium genosp. SA-3]|uniref:G1 family glutamic endopeptidase n=1 Tax=Bradyrhizobium genosp. SA-3 TaxID=508868 RepID=UPI00102A2403|nr:G1 family glutamic endopeptidase [Bradyrhizobium genosp. SA-3]
MGEMAKTFELSLDLFFKEIEQRAHAYPAPPKEFDPLMATRAQLEQFGLPPRPDEDNEPELFRLWARLLGKPLEIVATEFPKVVNGQPSPVPANRVGRIARPGFRRFQSSRNWSGGYLTPERSNKLVHVSGTWQVPDVSLPPILPQDATQGDEFQSSVWVGIDGRRRYPMSSMPQIGTSQCFQIVDGIEKKRAYAWWQWWSLDENYPPDNRNNPPVPIPNIGVSVNDEIIAGLTLRSADEVQFFIKNQTTGLFTTFLVVAPGPILPLGSTAEWIVERPTVIGGHRLYPLPSYTDVVFRDCLAQSAASIGAPATVQQLDRLQFIRMVEVFPTPHRTSSVSVPRKWGDRSIRVRYRDASTPGSGGLLS